MRNSRSFILLTAFTLVATWRLPPVQAWYRHHWGSPVLRVAQVTSLPSDSGTPSAGFIPQSTSADEINAQRVRREIKDALEQAPACRDITISISVDAPTDFDLDVHERLQQRDPILPNGARFLTFSLLKHDGTVMADGSADASADSGSGPVLELARKACFSVWEAWDPRRIPLLAGARPQL